MERVFLRAKMPLHFWAGAVLMLISNAGIFIRIEPFATFFYPFVWWSYILLIDGLVFGMKGSSLFSRLRVKICLLVLISFCFWEFFEFINLRLANWTYITPSFPLVVRKTFRFLSFSTVLPIILETYELLETMFKKEIRALGWKWLEKPSFLWIVVGAILFLLSLILPKYFFWAVWLALIFILDPWVKIISGESLFSELIQGNLRKLILLLVTGFFVGLLWEGWNYLAGIKWQYNVPFVGEWKLFEMPVLGYFGFMAFAIESYVFCRWINFFVPWFRDGLCL